MGRDREEIDRLLAQQAANDERDRQAEHEAHRRGEAAAVAAANRHLAAWLAVIKKYVERDFRKFTIYFDSDTTFWGTTRYYFSLLSFDQRLGPHMAGAYPRAVGFLPKIDAREFAAIKAHKEVYLKELERLLGPPFKVRGSYHWSVAADISWEEN